MIKFSKTLRILQNKPSFHLFILIGWILSGCAIFSGKKEGELLPHRKKTFQFVDKSGEYLLTRESGLLEQKNQIVVKRKLFSQQGKDKPFEKSISITTPGYIKKIKILRPHISQYSVWFDGKKYFTEISLNKNKKKLEVTMESPEEKWQGARLVDFPEGNGLYCFYTQIVECAHQTNFFSLSKQKKSGVMKFHIIWDGYPYIHEQYPDIPNDVFTKASFRYDGKNDDGHYRYSLNFANQTIFYMINDNNRLAGIHWVAQGLSISKMGQ